MTKILLIDDEEILQDLMSHALSKLGYDVLCAEDGEAGIEKAREHLPDLVISDMNMPRMTGWELVKALRADAATADIPFIALTAHVTTGDRDAGYDAGVSDYAEKPVDMAKLLKKIERLLGA